VKSDFTRLRVVLGINHSVISMKMMEDPAPDQPGFTGKYLGRRTKLGPKTEELARQKVKSAKAVKADLKVASGIATKASRTVHALEASLEGNQSGTCRIHSVSCFYWLADWWLLSLLFTLYWQNFLSIKNGISNYLNSKRVLSIPQCEWMIVQIIAGPQYFFFLTNSFFGLRK